MTDDTTTILLPNENDWLEHRLFWKVTSAHVLLLVIGLLAAGIYAYNIEAIGNANTYYTAAVEAMLDSWHNFFFIAAEPGGSVTIDKPPLGLWIEAGFAYLLGVSGFAVSLPNILSGLFSIPLLYRLVKRYLGAGPGLIAAAVLAFTPVMFSTGRNNTMDNLLVFTLLLAAWAFIEATERGSLGYLLLGGLIVGLGFNIKMMQAFLPLPAFLALYFFASQEKWWRKMLNLAITGVVIIVVSLSWALAVDSVPADQRPYIGSSTDNTVMELIVGHNGLNRLFGGDRQRQQANTTDGPDGQLPTAPIQDGQLQDGPPGDGSPAGQVPPGVGGKNNQEIGSPGVLRFFQVELANESSWLLVFGLVGIGLALFSAKVRIPVEADTHKALILWGGWLLTCLVFFSVAAFFHAYYMVMVAPALGAAVGLGWAVLRDWSLDRPGQAAGILTGAGVLTLVTQVEFAGMYEVGGWFLWAATILLVAGLVILFMSMTEKKIQLAGVGMIFSALLVIPLVWSVLTVKVESPNINLPSAYAGVLDRRETIPNLQVDRQNQLQDRLVDFLTAHDSGGRYLVAVPDSHAGSEIVLETGRGVLYMGGFNGRDPVVDVNDLADLVEAGDLSFVLVTSKTDNSVRSWLRNTCKPVDGFIQRPLPNANQPGADQPNKQPGQNLPPGGQDGPAQNNQNLNVLFSCEVD